MCLHHPQTSRASRDRESRKKEKGKTYLVSIIRDTRTLETASHLADVSHRTSLPKNNACFVFVIGGSGVNAIVILGRGTEGVLRGGGDWRVI